MIQVHVLIPVKLMIKLGFYVGGILRVVMLHDSKTLITGRKIPWYRCIKILFINWAQISPEAKSVWAKYNIYKLPPELSYLVEFTNKAQYAMISYQIAFIPQYGPS